MNKFWQGFLCGMLSVVLVGIVLPKTCNADAGVSLYSSYYSSAHMFGVVGEYTDWYDVEVGGYVTRNDASLRTGRTAILAQVNLKSNIDSGMSILYGLSVEIFMDGEINGVKYTGTGYGPYLGIQSDINESVSLRALYHPVYITNLNSGGANTTTTDFGLNGAFGLTYIF